MISIVIILRSGWLGVRILAETRKFSLLQIVKIVSGAHQPSIQCVPGFFPKDKAAGAWCRPLMLSSAEFKNEKSNAFTPTIRLHGFEGDNLTWLYYTEEVLAGARRVARASPDIRGTHLECYCSAQTANWSLNLGHNCHDCFIAHPFEIYYHIIHRRYLNRTTGNVFKLTAR